MNHLNMTCLYVNIGGCYLNQGDYEKALDHFENAYSLRKEILSLILFHYILSFYLC